MIKRILLTLFLILFMFVNADSFTVLTGRTYIPSTCFLTVTKSGTGSGVITSDPPGITRSIINCGATCTVEYLCGTTVTLTATPDGYDTFSGWTGGGTCTGVSTTCSVELTSDITINGIFNLGVIFVAEGNFTAGIPGQQDYAVSRNVNNLVQINRVQLGNVGWGGVAHMPSIINVPTINSIATWNVIYDTPLQTGTRIHLQNGETGYFYISGGTGTSETWIFQKRQVSDGALVWSRQQDWGAGSDNIKDLYYYNNNIYVAGNRTTLAVFQKWTSDNVQVWSYEPGVTTGDASGAAIFRDSDGFVYLAYRASVGNLWTVSKYTDANPPILQWAQVTNYGAQNPTKIRSDSTGNNIIVVGGNGVYIMEMRRRSDGVLLYGINAARSGVNNLIQDMTRVVNLGGVNTFHTSGHDFDGGAGYRARIEEIRESDFNLNQFITSNTLYRESTSGISTGSRANLDTVITGSMTYDGVSLRYDWLIQRRNSDDLTP